MEPLDPALAELIATETETVAPPQGAKARAWAAIGAGLGGVPLAVPVGGADAATATAAKTGAWLKIVGATALVGAVGTGVWATSRSPEPAPTPAVARTESAPVAEVVPDEEPPADEPTSVAVAAPEPEPQAEPEPEVVPDEETGTPAPEPRATKKSRPETAPTLGLAEELALVEKIRKAVAAGDHAGALKLAGEHRDSFPKGALRPDRLDLEATAYCARGQTERGRKLAAQLRESWPKAPVSDRLESTCKLDDLD